MPSKHRPGSRRHYRSSHQTRWTRQPADKNMLLYFQICQLRSIRRSMTIDSCHALILATVSSQLDNCNGSSAELRSTSSVSSPVSWGHRTPHPRILSRRSHMTDETALARHSRTSRLQTLCAGFSVSAPPYLADYFIPVGAIEGWSNLRSAATGQLLVPPTKTVTICLRAFAVSSPTAWNNLSVDRRDPNLKLSCFRKLYCIVLWTLYYHMTDAHEQNINNNIIF